MYCGMPFMKLRITISLSKDRSLQDCRTPQVTGTEPDFSPSITTLCTVSDRKDYPVFGLFVNASTIKLVVNEAIVPPPVSEALLKSIIASYSVQHSKYLI